MEEKKNKDDITSEVYYDNDDNAQNSVGTGGRIYLDRKTYIGSLRMASDENNFNYLFITAGNFAHELGHGIIGAQGIEIPGPSNENLLPYGEEQAMEFENNVRIDLGLEPIGYRKPNGSIINLRGYPHHIPVPVIIQKKSMGFKFYDWK